MILIYQENHMIKEITLSGRRLIDFCKIYRIYITNGRVGNDKDIGNFTNSIIIHRYCKYIRHYNTSCKDISRLGHKI